MVEAKGAETDSVRIGYGHPPSRTRFKKGRSGNPRGRPRGRQNITDVAARLFESRIPIRIGDETKKLSFLTALIEVHKSKAMRGDAKSLRAISMIMQQLGYYDEKAKNEPVGCLVLPNLNMNAEEWLWVYGRQDLRKKMRRAKAMKAEAETAESSHVNQVREY